MAVALLALTIATWPRESSAQDPPPPPPAAPAEGRGQLEPTFTAHTLAEARTLSRSTGRSVMVYISEDDNAQCASYAEYTWSDESTRRWIADHMIPVEIRLGADAEAARRLGISGAPTIVVISPTGAVSQPIVGFRSAASLIPLLQARLVDPVKAARDATERSAGEPGSRLALAKALVDAGAFDEALREYLQLIDGGFGAQHGDVGPRLLAVQQIGPLLKAHPPTRPALVQRRDALRTSVAAGEASATEASLYAGLNTQLGAVDDTVELYTTLRSQASDAVGTRLLRDGLVDSLIAARRYEQAMTIIDPIRHFEFALEVHKSDERRGAGDERFRTFHRDGFVSRAMRYYEILLGAGREEAAAAIANQVSELHPTASTHTALAEAALRTGRAPAAALDHVRRALSLSGEGPAYATLRAAVSAMQAAGQPKEAAALVQRYADRLDDIQQADALRAMLDAPAAAAPKP